MKSQREEMNAAKIISSSPYLSHIYKEVYSDMFLATRIDSSAIGLELGAGNVSFGTDFFPNLIISQGHGQEENDSKIIAAESIPYENESFDYIIAKDALHHFRNPAQALSEISRVLKPRGVFIVSEPYWSLLGRFIFRFIHPEGWNPRSKTLNLESNNPWESNQALLLKLFRKFSTDQVLDSGLRLKVGRISYGFSYALSGGVFSRNSIPDKFLIALNKFERRFRKINHFLLGLNIVAVFEKSSISNF